MRLRADSANSRHVLDIQAHGRTMYLAWLGPCYLQCHHWVLEVDIHYTTGTSNCNDLGMCEPAVFYLMSILVAYLILGPHFQPGNARPGAVVVGNFVISLFDELPGHFSLCFACSVARKGILSPSTRSLCNSVMALREMVDWMWKSVRAYRKHCFELLTHRLRDVRTCIYGWAYEKDIRSPGNYEDMYDLGPPTITAVELEGPIQKGFFIDF